MFILWCVPLGEKKDDSEENISQINKAFQKTKAYPSGLPGNIRSLNETDCVTILMHTFVSSQADFQHKFTVQASPTMDKRKSLLSSRSSPPASPTIIPRLRAIQCETGFQNTPGTLVPRSLSHWLIQACSSHNFCHLPQQCVHTCMYIADFLLLVPG